MSAPRKLRPQLAPWDPEGPPLPLPDGWTPRRWQVEAVAAIEDAWATWPSILVSAATGTGKGTLIASYIVREARQGRRCLFLVHRDELIEDVMARAVEIEPHLPVGKVQGSRNEVSAQCVFASVASLKPKRLKQLGHIDVVITDEAHHAPAPTYRRVYDACRAVNPELRHLGFTATPFRNAGGGETEGLGDIYDALVYEYDLQQAISDGALAPLEARRVELDVRLEDGQRLSDDTGLSKVLDTPPLNALVARKYAEHLAGAQAIAFCVSVAHAQHLAEVLREHGVAARAVWGDMPKREREATVQAYQDGRLAVLTNKDLLTEGFDAPATEGVLLVRPTESRGLFAQMVGRATRLHPGKGRGLVLDFVANSDTHDLAGFHDLSRPDDSTPATSLRVGTRVRHRSDKRLAEGAIAAIDGDEVLRAEVEWGPDDLRWHPTRELVRLVEGPEPDDQVFAIVPRVEGVTEYKVMLFGAGKAASTPREGAIGWYRYTRGTGPELLTAVASPTGTTKGDRCRAQLWPSEGAEGTWDVWLAMESGRRSSRAELLGTRLSEGEAADLVALAFERRGLKPKKLAARWQRDQASPGQVRALQRWGLRAGLEGLSKGEASWLMDTLIARAAVRTARQERTRLGPPGGWRGGGL